MWQVGQENKCDFKKSNSTDKEGVRVSIFLY